MAASNRRIKTSKKQHTNGNQQIAIGNQRLASIKKQVTTSMLPMASSILANMLETHFRKNNNWQSGNQRLAIGIYQPVFNTSGNIYHNWEYQNPVDMSMVFSVFITQETFKLVHDNKKTKFCFVLILFQIGSVHTCTCIYMYLFVRIVNTLFWKNINQVPNELSGSQQWILCISRQREEISKGHPA